jgi:hypothetical protein
MHLNIRILCMLNLFLFFPLKSFIYRIGHFIYSLDVSVLINVVFDFPLFLLNKLLVFLKPKLNPSLKNTQTQLTPYSYFVVEISHIKEDDRTAVDSKLA